MSERTEADTTGVTGQSGQTGSPGQSGQPHLSARAAADALGVNERTIRRWLAEGRIAAPKVRGSYRFAPDEIERARLVLLGEDESGNTIIEADTHGPERAQTDLNGPERTPGYARTDRSAADAALSTSARFQLESIRDEWLQPLIAQIKDQAEEIGRLKEAESRERARADAAEEDAEHLRDEIDALRGLSEVTRSPERPVEPRLLGEVFGPESRPIAPGSPNPEASRPFWKRLLRID